ncbi:MAG: serine/threonine-protein kinase [Candidatus Melainabacteria bacterium]|nr:serine/threonine-protein kinase [Candidatus Melainabacteria bacterium]
MDLDSRSLVTGKVCPACNLKYSPEMERCPDDNSLLAVVRRDPFIGKLIADKYQIVEVLGMGGFATVYKAEQKGLRRSVAIKILHAEFVDKPDKIRRFQHEAESISTLVHPNVAAVYDYGVLPEGQPYLAMELAPGTTLSSVLAESKRFDSERALKIFLQACDGISAAHAMGLIHRDIKPSNILLDRAEDGSDTVKILDFGLAKVVSDEENNREHLTMTGEVLGTPAYMSPEQCTGGPIDFRTDIYSFGCVMYEVLSGRLPIEGDNSYEMMNKHINEAPLSLSKSGAAVPPRLVKIVNKALEKDPADRFESFDELKDALKGLQPGLTSELKEILFSGSNNRLSKRKRSLKRKILLSFWCSTLVASGFVGLLIYENHSKQLKQEIAARFGEKSERIDCGVISFQSPALYAPGSAADKAVLLRLQSRIDPGSYIEFKHFADSPSVEACAKVQRRYHGTYKGFVEVMPISKFDFGKDKQIHGLNTEFLCERLGTIYRERHAYWGEGNSIWKLKVCTQETKDSKHEQVCDTAFNTAEYHPDKKFALPVLE